MAYREAKEGRSHPGYPWAVTLQRWFYFKSPSQRVRKKAPYPMSSRKSVLLRVQCPNPLTLIDSLVHRTKLSYKPMVTIDLNPRKFQLLKIDIFIKSCLNFSNHLNHTVMLFLDCFMIFFSSCDYWVPCSNVAITEIFHWSNESTILCSGT